MSQTMGQVRLLTSSDIPQAMLLKQAVGWNQTEQDWLRVLELEPEGCFGTERDGRLVATTTSTCYGRELAWIGMVITAPEFRGQGLATRLMRRTLEYLDSRQVQWVKLDATSLGRGVYLKFGFEDECPVERWLRAPAAVGASSLVDPGRWDAALDRRAFGADRSRLLSKLAGGESVSIPGSGYAMGRPGAVATYFGPCVAAGPEAARTLVESFLARHSNEPIYWDLLPDNQEAVRLARSFGFERSRQLVRMTRPGVAGARPLSTSVQEVYAVAGLEFG
jgi:GNAT superfamily N-acetyltransferase